MLDIILKNGTVVDVKNRKFLQADVGIKDGLIVKIGNIEETATEIIDLEGKYVSPGFIDIHMHEESISFLETNGYDIGLTMLNMGVTTAVTGNCGSNKQSIEQLCDFMKLNGGPVNYLSFIGHNFLREVVGNLDRYKKSTQEQICEIRKLINKAIDFGAIGVSFGLEYSPGTDIEEAIEVVKDLYGRKDLLIAAHYRKDAKYALDAINEMAEIARLTNIPFQISHLSSCSAYGEMKEALNLIDDIVNSGVDLTVDAYPYDAFSTYIGSAVYDDGCFELWNKDYSSIMLAEDPYKGVFCDEELFYKAKKEYPNMLSVAYVMIEDEVIEALKNKNVMIASDGVYNNNAGHPRGAGAFPRVLGKYVRDMNALDFFDAIYKMTLMPAERLLLKKKGILEEGMDADIVVFDNKKIIDKATYLEPQLKPEGIEHVVIDGKFAIKDGQTINIKCGKFIKNSER